MKKPPTRITKPPKTQKPDADAPRCGLCGADENLTRTECCGEWICDDEDSYVIFSFARNSCHRNHRRVTLCAYHHNEGHRGRWQNCKKCRESFPTEIYVWYGTSEYNFTKLENPPAYEATCCSGCKTVIKLSGGGYSEGSDGIFCEKCTRKRFRASERD